MLKLHLVFAVTILNLVIVIVTVALHYDSIAMLCAFMNIPLQLWWAKNHPIIRRFS